MQRTAIKRGNKVLCVVGVSKRLAEAHRQELQQLAHDADKAAILGKIKELVPAYTGWPRVEKQSRGSEAKPLEN